MIHNAKILVLADTGSSAHLVSKVATSMLTRRGYRVGAGAYIRKRYLREKIGRAIRDELNR